MLEAPFALAFTAGLVATVNPCGFAMLPAYLSYFMGLEDEPGADAVTRGLKIGAVVSAGFLTVFGIVGTLLTLGLRSIITALPWAAIVIGVVILVLGIAMLAGYSPVISLPKLGKGGQSRKYSGVYGFGVSYAVASLSCTLPVFLPVVAGVIPSTNLVSGILTFVVYGVGMSMVLLVLTLAMALGKQGLVRRLRSSVQYVNRIAGGILVLAGLYIVWYWAVNLSTGPLGQNSGFLFVERLSSQATEFLGDRPFLWAGLFGSVLAAAIGWAFWRRRQGGSGASTEAVPSEAGPATDADAATSRDADAQTDELTV